MKDVFITYGSLVTPLGSSVQENLDALKTNVSGVKVVSNSGFKGENWPLAKIDTITENRFSTLLLNSLIELKSNFDNAILQSEKTLFIISTTKADIENFPEDTFSVINEVLYSELGIKNKPIIVSNACISGVVAINLAADYIRLEKFIDVIVVGIDVVSEFVINGFQSLFALSDEIARPFDKTRKGISLGEGVGIVLLSSNKRNSNFHAKYINGSSSNDANHISGPSRTGEGLVRSINETLKRSNIEKNTINFISAHGTGTLYNDEMESIAFQRTELNTIPMNSLKGYFGHTLGAAGVIETIVSMLSMEHNILFQSLGFSEVGTTEKLNLIEKNEFHEINCVLKTASGFGGGNASLILVKEVK